MNKKYPKTEIEMKKILSRELETPPLVEKKIQDAYAAIRAEAAEAQSVEVRKAAQPPTVYRYRRKTRWLATAAAACALTVSAAVTAAALGGFFTRERVRKEESLSYRFEVNYDLLPYKVRVTPEYIPEGYACTEKGEDYCKYDKEGFRQNGISILAVTADYVGVNKDSLSVSSVKEIEERVINGMEADLLTLSYDKEQVTRTFDKRIYLFNPQEGYVGIVYGGNDLTMDELVKVAENLKFTPTEERTEPVDLEAAEKERAAQEEYDADEKRRLEEKFAAGVPAEQVFDVGETFTWGSEDFEKFELTALETEIFDSVEGFSMENFFDADAINARLKEDGTLKPYERITFRREPGYEEGEELLRDEAEQKLLTVKLKAVNLSAETEDFWVGAPALTELEEEADGRYPYGETYSRPLNRQEYGISESEAAVYFDGYAGEEGRNHFFYRELAPGESFTYTLGFIVDADKLDRFWLNFGGRYSTDPELEPEYEKYVKIK